MANKVILPLNDDQENNDQGFLPAIASGVKSIAQPSGWKSGEGIPIIDRNLKRMWEGMKIPAGINVSPPTPAQATVPAPTNPQDAALDRINKSWVPLPPAAPSTTVQPSYTGDIASSMKKLMAGNPNLKVDFNGETVPGSGSGVVPTTGKTSTNLSTSAVKETPYVPGHFKTTTDASGQEIGTYVPGSGGSPSKPETRQDKLAKMMDSADRELRFATALNGPNPTKEGTERIKNALAMVQAIGGMVNQEATQRNIETQHNKPTHFALSPGQKSFSMSPTGEITPGPDNMEPYSQDKEQKQKAALGKQASAQIHGSYNAFSKNWDAISKKYPGASEKDATGKLVDPASYKARESELRDSQTNFFRSMGVNDADIAGMPVNEQTFIEEQLGNKKGTPEKIKELKALHKAGLATRKRLIDLHLQSMGYHEGNRSSLTPNSGYLPSNEE